MAVTSLKELNKLKLFTLHQLKTHKKFKDKQLSVYPHDYTYWQDGVGFVRVYEVRGISDTVRENYESVSDI